jgi:cell division protein FtsB
VAVLVSFFIVMGGLLAMPVTGYLEQRSVVAAQEARLDAVRAENERMEQRMSRLDDPAEIERVARREYGLVEVGEESYTVLPPGTAGVVLPRAWPFDRLADGVAAASTGP